MKRSPSTRPFWLVAAIFFNLPNHFFAQKTAVPEHDFLGSVNGSAITKSEFDNYLRHVYSTARLDEFFQTRAQSWDYFLDNRLTRQFAEIAGLGVPEAEVEALEFGDNPSLIIEQRFSTSTGYGVNRETLEAVRNLLKTNAMQPDGREYWMLQRDEIITARLKQKITTLFAKAAYAPTWQREMLAREVVNPVEFEYVFVPYELGRQGENSKQQLTEIQQFLDKNERRFWQYDETRRLEYVIFDVNPSAADTSALWAEMQDLASRWRRAGTASFSGADSTFQAEEKFLTPSEVPENQVDNFQKASIGTVLEPFFGDDKICVSKILSRRIDFDSVKARHILIRENSTDEEANRRLAEEIRDRINTRQANFPAMARAYGSDPTAERGGDLGWFTKGVMVPEFNDYCFFHGKMGEVGVVKTAFGWHVVEVTGRKPSGQAATRVSTVRKRLVPGDATLGSIEKKAQALAAGSLSLEALRENARRLDLQTQVSAPLRENDFSVGLLGAGSAVRWMVLWAYEAERKPGDVSAEIFPIPDPAGGGFSSKFAVVSLKNIQPKGHLQAMNADEKIFQKVENQLITNDFLKKIGTSASLESVAKTFGLEVQRYVRREGIYPIDAYTVSQTNASYALRNDWLSEPWSPQKPTLENDLEAAKSRCYSTLKKGETSRPFAGESGIVLVRRTEDSTTFQTVNDWVAGRQTAGAIQSHFFKILKRDAVVVDRRSRFW